MTDRPPNQIANELAEKVAYKITSVILFSGNVSSDKIDEHQAQLKQTILQDLNLESLIADGQMLRHLIENQWYVSWSSDGEVCNVWKQADRDDEAEPVEGYPQKVYHDWRTAITAAMNKDAEMLGN